MAKQLLHECTICNKTYDIEEHEFCPKCGEAEEDWEEVRDMLNYYSNHPELLTI